MAEPTNLGDAIEAFLQDVKKRQSEFTTAHRVLVEKIAMCKECSRKSPPMPFRCGKCPEFGCCHAGWRS